MGSRAKNLKSKKMRRLSALLICVFLAPVLVSLLLPFAAMASNHDAKIEKMSIMVEPEYDDPRVLAVLEPTLSEDTKLPRKAKYMIPKSANDITIGMACEVPEGQGHRCKVYDTVDAGNFNALTYQVDTARNLFLEYYWDPFKNVKDGKKSFVYEYKAPYPINELNVQVQQPLKATDFKVEPATEDMSQDEKGFKYHAYQFKDVKADQVFTFNVNYTKTNPEPSIKPGEGIAQVNQANPSEQPASNPGAVRIMLFFFILLFTAGVLGVYWRSKLTAVEAMPVAKPKAGRPKKATGAKVAKSRFCGNCGSELNSDNKFCSECGSEVA